MVKPPSAFESYATADARSLAVGRIALALVLLQDLCARAANIESFYSNRGLLPNHTVLWRPTADYVFSPFLMASHVHEAAILFLICGAAYVALLFGWRTKLAQVASWICVLGLHGRTLFVQNGGDVVLVLLAFWTMFLPTGERFSLDALSCRGNGVASNNDGQIKSLAVTALLLQLVAIYALNAIHKNGVTWREGTVVHYVLHQDRIVTWLGVWLRDHMTLTLSQCLTWAALAIEALIPLLLLLPFAQGTFRTLAVGLVFALHTGFGLVMNLGIFVPVMLAFGVHLLPWSFWEKQPSWPGRVRKFVQGKAAHLETASTLLLRLANTRPAESTRTQVLAVVRERVVLVFMLLSAGQLMADNHTLRRWGSFHQPAFARMITEYLQLHQGWGMFAPEAPRDDFNVVVDAVTIDGRHVDPFNSEASRQGLLPLFTSPSALGQNWLFCDYIVGIHSRGEYHQAFSEWLQNHAQRTGNPNDRIVAFEAFVVTDDSPPPGESEPRNLRKESFLQWADK